MIALTTSLAFVVMAMQAAAANVPRQQFVACIKQSVEKAKSDKILPDAFAAFARSNCAGQFEAFKQGLVSFDVKNGVARKRAEADAELQIDDYLIGAAEKLAPDS